MTTLKPQHPVPELFRSYPALSVTSDCECNRQYIRGAGGEEGVLPIGNQFGFQGQNSLHLLFEIPCYTCLL